MKQIDKDKARLQELNLRRQNFMAVGKILQVIEVTREIMELEEKVFVAEYTKRQSVGKLLEGNPKALGGTIWRSIKLHFAADYLAKCAYELNDFLDGQGLELKTFASELKQLGKDADRLAGRLVRKDEGFEDMLINNDTLLEAIDKKVDSYLSQRMLKKNQKEDDGKGTS